jgi:DmsE family decaheme c-type cytochrome
VGCLWCHSPAATRGERAVRADAEKHCGNCHQKELAEFRLPNHHRVPEGQMFCSDCHDPHGARPRIHDLDLKKHRCVSCHREYAGPFVFEHQVSRSEGCVACHTPHGSANLRMLHQHRTQQNCLQCHADFPAFHDQSLGSVFTNCINCHSEVHGSNTSRFLFR